MSLLNNSSGEGGETLIKLLIFAIILVIAIALAKSFFQESARQAEQVVETAYGGSDVAVSSSLAPFHSIFNNPAIIKTL